MSFCSWKQDCNGIWGTSCGGMFEFVADGPAENEFNHCPYCGSFLRDATAEPSTARTTTRQVIDILKSSDLLRVRSRMVARDLVLSDTTFRRRLRSEGVSFAKLLESERRRRCLELIDANHRLPGKSLADECGYSELNSFYRAFQNWMGVSFRDYKIHAAGQ